MNSERAAFKAILWKEFRENLKWAVLGLILVSLGVVYCVERLITNSAYGGGLNWSDLSFGLFGLSRLLPPVVGLMIGLAQVVLENRGDNWGFLTHRPVPRSTLFWGKAVSGILLYFVAVSVPLVCGLLWIATPGHLPMPFDVHMTFPVIADILCGLVYYFAGLLTGMRDARWYASRVMGIGSGVVCSSALSVVPEFWQAVTCCTIGILISAASAWGAFVEGGRFGSQPRVTRFATAVTIGAGLLITGSVIFAGFSSFLPAFNGRSSDQGIVFTGDGDAIADVLGLREMPMVSSQMISPSIHYSWNGDYRNPSEYFQAIQSNDALSNGAAFTWYYIPRIGRFAAYQNRPAKLIGWLGPHGFTSGTAIPEDRFERPLVGTIFKWGPTLISFEDAVFRLDLNHRYIEKIFTADSGESIIGASDSNSGGPRLSELGDKARFVAISTAKRVVIQSGNATPLLSAPRDSNNLNYGSVIVYRSRLASEPQTFVLYTNGFNLPALMTQYGPTGTRVGQYTIPGRFHPETLTWGYALLLSVTENVAMRTLLSKYSIFRDAFIQPSPGQRLVSWLIPLLEGVLFAALAFSRGRRYAFSRGRLFLWSATGFALGPLGYALMLSLLEWPAFEKCSACSRPRLVTRDNCEHCSKPFSLPHADGTEVFEPVPSN